MNEFLTGNDPQHRLYRTIVQGIIGVVVANIDLILGHTLFDPETRAILAALVMAVLSPIMAALGAEGTTGPVEITDVSSTGKHARTK